MAKQEFTNEADWAEAAKEAGLHGPHSMQGHKQLHFVDNRGITAAHWDGAVDTGWVESIPKPTVLHTFSESPDTESEEIPNVDG